MAYQVLARKWRPKRFADLVGQEHVVKALQNALAQGRLHHAYLLTGTRGVGKTTIARILAKSLNCEAAVDGEPCGVCESCKAIDAGRYVDLLEIDAASNTGIDNIREVLENAQYAPTEGRYKVYIIDEVHMLSKSAFNAMLKTLEEPPEHVKFILATTDPHKVPITVLSRCLQFVLRNMTAQQVSQHLAYVLSQEGIDYEPEALQLLGRAAAGSMRDALSLLDQAIALGSGRVREGGVRQMIGAVDTRYLYELLDAIVAQDGALLMARAEAMAARAVGFDNALNELSLLLQRIALMQAAPAALQGDGEAERLAHYAAALSGEQLQLYYQCVIHGKRDLALAPDEYAGFMMTLIRLLAFAPLAAETVAPEGQIVGSQLHNPAPALEETQKKSLAEALPQAAVPEEEGAQNKGLPETDEAAQDERLPETASLETADRLPETNNAIESDRLPENNHVAAHEGLAPTDTLPEANESAPDDAPAQVLSVQPAAEIAEEAMPQERIVEEAPLEVAEVAPSEDGAAIPSEFEQPSALADEAWPPLRNEYWGDIVRRLAKKLGAMQMVTQNMVIDDEESGVDELVLMLRPETEKLWRTPYLARLQAMLSEAYEREIVLRLATWQDGVARETPKMISERRKQEAKEQAYAALEADPVVQQMRQVFGGNWADPTVALLQDAPKT